MVINGSYNTYSSKEYERERRKERRIRQTKRQCTILVILTVLLAAVLVFRIVHSQRERERETWNQIYTNEGAVAGLDTKGTADTALSGYGEGTASTAFDSLVLVNKDHALPADYPVNLHWLENKTVAVAEEMYGALRDMLTAGTEEGLSFVVASGYRSGEFQQQLLEEDIAASMERGLTYQQAYDKETRETMPPGYSEHETGLAVDIVALDYQILDEMQEMTAENVWLQENCSRFGFILRYPKGSEDATGIDYESWHFRYVGQEAAAEIMSRGITLEEYLKNK